MDALGFESLILILLFSWRVGLNSANRFLGGFPVLDGASKKNRNIVLLSY
jgi:hypothetical protein